MFGIDRRTAMKFIIITFKQNNPNEYRFIIKSTAEWFVHIGWGERIREMYNMNSHDASFYRVMDRVYNIKLTKEIKQQYNIFPKVKSDIRLPYFLSYDEAEFFANDFLIPLEVERRNLNATRNHSV